MYRSNGLCNSSSTSSSTTHCQAGCTTGTDLLLSSSSSNRGDTETHSIGVAWCVANVASQAINGKSLMHSIVSTFLASCLAVVVSTTPTGGCRPSGSAGVLERQARCSRPAHYPCVLAPHVSNKRSSDATWGPASCTGCTCITPPGQLHGLTAAVPQVMGSLALYYRAAPSYLRAFLCCVHQTCLPMRGASTEEQPVLLVPGLFRLDRCLQRLCERAFASGVVCMGVKRWFLMLNAVWASKQAVSRPPAVQIQSRLHVLSCNTSS